MDLTLKVLICLIECKRSLTKNNYFWAFLLNQKHCEHYSGTNLIAKKPKKLLYKVYNT